MFVLCLCLGVGVYLRRKRNEKVINLLSKYKNCSFGDKDEKVTVEDIIALLKAQEPVEPVFERQFMTSIEIYDCGKCGTSLGAKGIAKYCMECGQAVKWV